MGQLDDIREYKNRLRKRFRAERAKLSASEKLNLDEGVFNRVLKLNQYAFSKTILTYVSMPNEVDTLRLINKALADGKRVAVPYCIPDTRKMQFYVIESLDELHSGAFGVMEPTPSDERLLTDFESSICFVPGLSFDQYGYRLGYGKGYYDRFLSNYPGAKIGLCYSSGLRDRLRHGRFDRTVDVIVTEKVIRSVKLKKRFEVR